MPKFVDVTDKSAAQTVLGLAPTFSVTSYGATGGGETDDTSAIHLARAAAGVGGEVSFPAGTYLVDGLTASVADQTWRLHAGATIKMATGADNCLEITANGVTVEGGTFDASNGTLTDWSQHAIRFDAVDDITIRNATVVDSPKHGIYGTNGNRAVVEGCTFTGNYDAAVFIQNGLAEPSNTSDHRIINNRVESSSTVATGLVVRGESPTRTVSRVTVSGNHVRLLSPPSTVDPCCLTITSGVDYVVADNVFEGGSFSITNPDSVRGTITGNIVRGFHKIGIELPGTCDNVAVTGNSIDCDWSADVGSLSSDVGIIFSNGSVTNLTISGNTISGFSEESIGIAFSSNAAVVGASITGNTITSTVASGQFTCIYANHTLTDVVISGNVFDCGSTANSYGISLIYGATGLVVTGNSFSNIAVNPLLLSALGGNPYTDVRFTGNVVRNCGVAVGGAGATAGTRIVTDTTPSLESTATAAGTTTLTVDSGEVQVFTGTTTQTCILPTTSVIAGRRFTIVNNSTGLVTVNASGGSTVAKLAAGGSCVLTALQATPTTAAHWSYSLNSLSLDTIKDTNGNTALALTATAAAVNHVSLINSSTVFPTVAAAGSDTNVNLALQPKGVGYVTINNSSGTPITRFYRVSAGVNYFELENSSTGNPIKLYAAGSDSNVSINVIPKGSGTLQVNASPVGVKVGVPASAAATGVPGQWAAESGWLYICVAADTWERVAIASW